MATRTTPIERKPTEPGAHRTAALGRLLALDSLQQGDAAGRLLLDTDEGVLACSDRFEEQARRVAPDT
jgi:hypothetical protein